MQTVDTPRNCEVVFKTVVLDLKMILLEKTSFRFSKFLVSISKSYSPNLRTCNNQFYVILKIGLVLNLHFLKQNPCLDRSDLTVLCIL